MRMWRRHDDCSWSEPMNKQAIVVADRESHQRMVACFEALGSPFRFYDDPVRASRHIEECPAPSLFVVDLDLPSGMALALCEDIRRAPRLRHVPLVLMVAQRAAPEEAIALSLDAGVLVKPFTAGMFATMVHRLEGRARAARRWRGRPRVLIADDDADLLDALAGVAVDGGFEPICAGDGLTALELYRKCSELPSLALIDWMMPGLDGVTLAQRLREEAARDVSVFLMSGYDEALRAPPDQMKVTLLRKPFALERVARIIREIDAVTG